MEYIGKYKDLIKEQILILNPDIIVCGDASGAIKDFVGKYVYQNLIKVNSWMYYDKNNNKLIIGSYHPSCRKSPKEIYSKMMTNYKDFLDKVPAFKESCRK